MEYSQRLPYSAEYSIFQRPYSNVAIRSYLSEQEIAENGHLNGRVCGHITELDAVSKDTGRQVPILGLEPLTSEEKIDELIEKELVVIEYADSIASKVYMCGSNWKQNECKSKNRSAGRKDDWREEKRCGAYNRVITRQLL